MKTNLNGVYNFNAKYISILIKEKNLDRKEIAKAWGLNPVNTNRRITGYITMTPEQAIILSNLLKMDFKDVFCPSMDTVKSTITNNALKDVM